MKVSTERLDNCQVNFVIEMDAAEVDEKLRQTARKISNQFTVPGYRRGKAPFHAVLRVFGREAIQQQALEDFGNELYEKALKEIEYEPYETGALKDVEWEPFRMTVLLPIRPEVDLGDYRAVRVLSEPEPVTDGRVEQYLEELQQRHIQWVPVERPAAFGDQVMLDMKGAVGDDVIMDKEDHEMLLQAEDSLPLPGFHEQIVGMSPGDEKTFVLAVPEDDSHEAAAGENATIVARMHTVKEKNLPPLDDELAMMVGDYDSLDALKAGVRENLEAESRKEAEEGYLDKVLEAMIAAAVKIEYPSQAIDREADLMVNQMEMNLASAGIQLDRYLAMIGKTREAYRREMHPSAEERLRKRLVLTQLAEQEKIQIAPEEVEAEIEQMSEAMGDRADEMQEMLSSPEGRLSVTNDLLMARVQERVVQIGKGEAPPLKEEVEGEAEVEVEAGAEAEEPVPEASTVVEEAESRSEAGAEAEEAAIEAAVGAAQEGDPKLKEDEAA
jgi:trigger factor